MSSPSINKNAFVKVMPWLFIVVCSVTPVFVVLGRLDVVSSVALNFVPQLPIYYVMVVQLRKPVPTSTAL